MSGVRDRRWKQFFLTVGGLEYYVSIRSDFLLYFEGFEDFVSFHVSTLNVQSVKSRRNVLKYISKEDEDLFFDIRESKLSFGYQAGSWARRTPTFRYSDPFVLEHPQYYRLLHELHSERRVGRSCSVSGVQTVCEWWPGWCMQVLLPLRKLFSGRTWKRLYIYGRSGIGKTFFDEKAVRIWDFRNFTCLCPEIFSLPPIDQNYMIVCYLRNLNLTLINPTFGNLREYWKESLLVLMLSFGMQEA
jgi:hypothetical protein